jgi:Domain of unknown function (DUF5666)
MKKHSFALTCALLLSTFAAAHGNMDHVMGTVSEFSSHSISVKATDGTTKVVEFDGETKFLKGESPAAASDVHVGDRVVIHAHKMDTMLHAAEVKIGTAKAAAQK